MALTSTEVHNVTVAMFGAAAGGYTEELQAFESQTALVEFLATLDLFETQFPQTTNVAFAQALVAQMASSATADGTAFAVDWIAGQLANGATRAEVIDAAITALLATESADFADAKADFIANVDGAVAFSAANADVTDVAELQAGVAATTADLALTAALDAYAAANTAVSDMEDDIAALLVSAFSNADVKAEAAEAGGLTNEVVGTLDASDVNEADVADALIASAATAAASGATNLDSTETVAQQTADIDAGRTVLETAVTNADAAVTAAAADLETGSLALINGALAKADALKAKYDAYDATVTAANVAEAGVETAAADTTVVLQTADATYTANVGAGTATAITQVSAAGVVSLTTAAVLNAAGTSYTITTGATSTTVAKSYLDALVTAAQAELDAVAAYETAEDSLDAAVKLVLESEDAAGTYTLADANNGWTVGASNAVTLDFSAVATAAAGATAATEGDEADAYLAKVDLADTADENLATFETDVAAYLAVKEIADELDALNEQLGTAGDAADEGTLEGDVTAAEEAIEDSVADGGLGVALGTWGASDDTKAEVYVYDADTADNTLPSFGVDKEDQIYFGEGVYTLVALAEDAVLADENTGDAAALEIFWEETATALVLYVENESFAGNSATGTQDITTITLTGVEAADITFATGYLSVGA